LTVKNAKFGHNFQNLASRLGCYC